MYIFFKNRLFIGFLCGIIQKKGVVYVGFFIQKENGY